MICPKCGKQIPDQAEFCPKCGLPINKEQSAEHLEMAHKKRKRNKILITGVLTAAVVLGVGTFMATRSPATKSYNELIRTAEHYLLDQDYEKAEVLYKEAMNIDPKKRDAYDGLYSIYELQGNMGKKQEIVDLAKREIPDQTITGIDSVENPNEEVLKADEPQNKANVTVTDSHKDEKQVDESFVDLSFENKKIDPSSENKKTDQDKPDDTTENKVIDESQLVIQEIGKLKASPVDIGTEGWIIEEGNKIKFLKTDGTIEETFSAQTKKAMSKEGIVESTDQKSKTNEKNGSDKTSKTALAGKDASLPAKPKYINENAIALIDSDSSSDDDSASDGKSKQPADSKTALTEKKKDVQAADKKDNDPAEKEDVPATTDKTDSKTDDKTDSKTDDKNESKENKIDKDESKNDQSTDSSVVAAEEKKSDLGLYVDSNGELVERDGETKVEEKLDAPILTVCNEDVPEDVVDIQESLSDATKYYIYSPDGKQCYGPYTREDPGCFAQKLWTMEDLTLESTAKTKNPETAELQGIMGPYWMKESKSNKKADYIVFSSDGKKSKKGFEDAEVISPKAIGVVEEGQYVLLDKDLNVIFQGDVEAVAKPIGNVIPIKEKGVWKLVQFDVLKKQQNETSKNKESDAKEDSTENSSARKDSKTESAKTEEVDKETSKKTDKDDKKTSEKENDSSDKNKVSKNSAKENGSLINTKKQESQTTKKTEANSDKEKAQKTETAQN